MNIKKEISPKLISLVFSILVICFLAAFYIIAWTEPSQAPPGDNITPPLNSGPDAQSKDGGLIINTGGAEYGLSVALGKVGIGTLNPSEKLEVDGDVKAQGFMSADGTIGATSGITVKGSDGNDCVISFKNGLFVSTTCP